MNAYLKMNIRQALGMIVCGALVAGALAAGTPPAAGTTVLENALYQNEDTETYKLLQKFGGTEKIRTPGVIVFNIFQIILGFLGIVGVIMMIYAGFLWLTARGEEEQAKQGRTLLFQAAIGTLIVLAAYTVTYFVIEQLTLSVTKQ